ncbi:Clavaminate synthase-like protein [Leucogyrophana mollusca]|uniref:Clavaminate synthase-like protein n=1 Tax=Leucogyrophana mollusca TaxID=85980 RepID=A0ACB8BHL4_9AGAM|nr:Clavaminate synthase-like protein [Leucogyrophana mollusca]
MPGTTLPPFPDDVRTHPLLIIDFERIKAGDREEIDTLWKAATSLGFWYLKNHGADEEVNGMFDMGAETMALPLEERMKFEQGDDGRSFGYKKAGANAVDPSGQTLDTVEFINVSKDDALAYPEVAHRTYPSTVNARMESTIAPFIRKALEVNYTFLEIFNERLGLPEGTLARLHDLAEHSGSESRCTRNPPMPGKMSAERAALGAHTDFGSLSFLHNRLGGLQVLPPGHEQWSYVKPLPGHAICNIGDALSLFSGGILQSNIHRVVPPPGAQAEYERWSLVFFIRPGNSKILRALVEDSPIIADAVKKRPGQNFETGSTAAEWFARRIRNQRIKNRTGPETWYASRGTEHTPTVI